MFRNSNEEIFPLEASMFIIINRLRAMIIIGLIGLALGSQGCRSNDSVNPTSSLVESTPTPKSTETFVKNVKEEIILKDIIGNEALQDQKQTPEEAVVHSIQWKMSNDTIISASKDSIVSSHIIGKNSLVSVKLPETTKTWYNFIFLSYKDQKWEITGVVDLPIPTAENLSSEKEGLSLPMSKFAAIKFMGQDSNSDHSWIFANESKFAVIGKYPREALTLPASAKEVLINGHDAWVSLEKESSLLFYFDQEYLIWISGNMSLEEIQSLANSLPSVASPRFPTKIN
ncbi:hypothetical protein GK047_02600 [Paenibacillus sp. SYP-B3998]|uniref:DUF4367 domain-containing protein n=1 Tax=Paenibacillus sp. SYP-B3998 TaxID=2678564 RepID=A0A6G3ZU14_9BACL|nr:hypothetical protein [Paenibacillus sp. SYP-B3998]NEW04907.1 hypothetical protein [Paenibacillus sp. SYP-B3998]